MGRVLRAPSEVAAGLCVAGVLLLAYGMYRETASYESFIPALFPRLVLGATAVLCAAFWGTSIVHRVLAGRRPGGPVVRHQADSEELDLARLGLFAAGSGLYVLGIAWLGFYASTLLYMTVVPAALQWSVGGRRAVRVASLLGASLLTVAVVYLLKTAFLRFTFPGGIAF
jgi:hypothetical protein